MHSGNTYRSLLGPEAPPVDQRAAPTFGGSGTVALHAYLQELLAKPQEERRQSLEQLYVHAVPEYVSSVLESGEHYDYSMRILREVIASLYEHRVHTNDSLTFSQERTVLRLGAQLSQQFVFLTCISSKGVDSFSSALSAGRSHFAVQWSIALPVLSSHEIQNDAPLLRALFERGEWLNASRHLFVVPLLVGSAQDVSRVDASVREFCVHLQDDALVMGRVVSDLLQLHVERSARMAAYCIRLVCEWGAVWKAFWWTVEWTESNLNADMSERVADIDRVVNSTKWRSTQRDLLISLVRCERLWLYPVDDDEDKHAEDEEYKRANSGWNTINRKLILFNWESESLIWMKLVKRTRTKLAREVLMEIFKYCAKLMDIIQQEVTSESQNVSESQKVFLETLLLIPVRQNSVPMCLSNNDDESSVHNNAATLLLEFWTDAVHMKCECAMDTDGHSALNGSLRESLLRLPFARCAALALRSCSQCCSVWSVLERCVELAECLTAASQSTDALADAAKAIGAKVQSEEWRVEMRHNLTIALSSQDIWLFGASNWSALWTRCFIFAGRTQLFSRLHQLLHTNVNGQCLKAVVSCVFKLLAFAAQLFEKYDFTAAAERSHTVAAVGFSFGDELRELEIDADTKTGFLTGAESSDDGTENSISAESSDDGSENASSLLLLFLVKAICFQESCRNVCTPTPELDALVEVPLAMCCLPFAFRTCYRPLRTLKFVTDWVCDTIHSERAALVCIAALEGAMQSADWRTDQQSRLSAALRHGDLWRYPLAYNKEAIKLSGMCFIFNADDKFSSLSSILECEKHSSPAIRTQLFQLVRFLLDFGLQLLRQVHSPSFEDAPFDKTHAPLWSPTSVQLDKSLAILHIHRSASTQLTEFWISALESPLFARDDSVSAADTRSLLSLRLRVQAALTGLVYAQLDDRRESESEHTTCVFDYRYCRNVRALFALLEQNLRTLSALDANEMAQCTDWPEVERVYKWTLRILWTLAYPVHLMSETPCENEQQRQSIEEFNVTFQCVLTIKRLVKRVARCFQLHTSAFSSLYFSDLKQHITKIYSKYVQMKELMEIICFDPLRIHSDDERLENWSSYLHNYSEMLTQFYQLPFLNDFSFPFTVPSLVCPCLIVSLYDLPWNLASIRRAQLQNEATHFKSWRQSEDHL